MQGWQQGWLPAPTPGRLLLYPTVRIPKGGEAEARVLGARIALARTHERPDLVHGHFLYEVGVAAVRLARSLGVPSVVTVHGTDGRWLVEGGVQDRFRRRMLAAARAADRVVVVEGGLATKLVAMGVERERVRVIPMGLDEKVFVPADREQARRALGVDPDVRLVLFVGRPTKEKGIEVLERALSSLPASVHAVAVGPRGLEGGRIEYAGPGGPELVAQWLAAADLLCLPSFAEGSPASVVEALASGRPVVASAVGGIPGQVENGVDGLLVTAGDSAALASALEAALDREWSPARLRASSRRFWWSELAPRIQELYEEIL